MTSYRLTLVFAGAFCIAVIAAATVMAHPGREAPWPLLAMLLGTYALGLALGRLILVRRE